MAMSIQVNQLNGKCVIHTNASNTMTIVGNTTNGSNVAIGTETITGATITKAIWGVDAGGSIQVKRNTTLVATYTESGEINYVADAMPLSANAAETLVITVVGSANAAILLELNKLGVTEGQY